MKCDMVMEGRKPLRTTAPKQTNVESVRVATEVLLGDPLTGREPKPDVHSGLRFEAFFCRLVQIATIVCVD